MKKRCEDFFFGSIFVIISLVFIFCYIYVIVLGDVNILTENFDCFGNICGKSQNIYDSSSSVNMTGRKFLMHTNFLQLEKSIPVCVKQCPNQTIVTITELSEFIQETGSYLCDCRVPLKMQLSQPRIGDVPLCPELPITQSVPVHGICIPVEWRYAETTNDIRFGFPKRDKISTLKLNEDVDFAFPWGAPLICLALTWGFAILILLGVTFFPTQSITMITVFSNLGLIGLIACLLVRACILTTNPYTVNRRLNYPFAPLDRYSLVAFGCLIAGFLIVLIVLDLILFLLWRSDSHWKRSQLLIMRTLFRLVSEVLRELPCLIVFAPIVHLFGLYTLLLISGLIVLQMCTIVEPVRMKFTGCLVLQQHAWVQYGLIPAHVLYSMWVLRFYMALCQVTTSVPVIIWYSAAATNANIPISRVLGTICQKLRMQSLGSIGFASLLSTLNWFPLQVLTCLRTVIRQEPLDEQHEIFQLKKLWTLESLLRQLDCNIYTMIASEQKSFSKAWSHLNTGICEQSVPIKLIELMRWCEMLFTLAKLACSTTATLIAFAYFSNKPPVSQVFPFILFASFLASYLTASIVVGTLQHILSTIMISFCLQEEQRFANEVFNDEVLIGFRHEEIKAKLAFITESKQRKSSWPNVFNRKPAFYHPDVNDDDPSTGVGLDQCTSEMNIMGRVEEISV